MDWVIISGAAFTLAVGLLITSIIQHGGVRSIVFYSLSMVLSVFAGALAESFVGFRVSEFYVYGLWTHDLYVPPLWYPNTIVLLSLYMIFIALGGYSHYRKRRRVRQSPV